MAVGPRQAADQGGWAQVGPAAHTKEGSLQQAGCAALATVGAGCWALGAHQPAGWGGSPWLVQHCAVQHEERAGGHATSSQLGSLASQPPALPQPLPGAAAHNQGVHEQRAIFVTYLLRNEAHQIIIFYIRDQDSLKPKKFTSICCGCFCNFFFGESGVSLLQALSDFVEDHW